ncbi:hypothetical protein CP974_14340 [Streptomyces fradiae ATCC 10745 = DSM 40063]|nr:hypothetical protein CP974_14340 [Streptomyces fradiae ATCC 10745 = DSM 40063]
MLGSVEWRESSAVDDHDPAALQKHRAASEHASVAPLRVRAGTAARRGLGGRESTDRWRGGWAAVRTAGQSGWRAVRRSEGGQTYGRSSGTSGKRGT